MPGSSWLASRRDPPEQLVRDSGVLGGILYRRFFLLLFFNVNGFPVIARHSDGSYVHYIFVVDIVVVEVHS